MTPSDFALTEDETEALVCLRELIALARAGGATWPGWGPDQIPYLLYEPSGNAFLVNHPFPPAEFYVVDAGQPLGRVFYYHGELRRVRRAGGGEINGFDTAVVPISLGTGLDRGEIFLAKLAGEAFRVHQKTLGHFSPLPRVADSYPDLDPENNALSSLEGRILYDALALAEADSSQLAELVRHFLAVREARQKRLSWEMARFEVASELYEGLAAYAEDGLLLFGSRPEYHASQCWREFFGRDRLEHGAEVVAKRRERLPHIGRHGEGATGDRFALSGSAQAHLLDRLRPRWHAEVDQMGACLSEFLAASSGYEPAAAPSLLEAAKEAHDFAAEYQSEQLFSAEEGAKREALLASVLATPGRRFVFDVSRVRMTSSDVDPERIQRIDHHRRIHLNRCTFFYRETILDFRGLPVVEDRSNDTLLLSIPPGRLEINVDRQPFSPSEHSRFNQRFELTAPGVKVVAASGEIEYDEGTVYIRVER